MNHASLFSGIGGFDLAAEWMGWNNVLSCEIDPFCQKVLKYYWPKAIHYENIKTTDFTIHRGQVDIITGGFPCQPFSMAGKRRGTEDDRHLWPEMLRAIREIKPRWVVGENVFGFVNWSGGMVFREVISDMENEGYEVQPFIIPACAVNAPHRRDRVWIVAHRNDNRQERTTDKIGCGHNTGDGFRNLQICEEQRWDDVWREYQGSCQNGPPADTEKPGKHGINGNYTGQEKENRGRDIESNGCCDESTTSDTERQRHTGKEHRQTKPGQYTEADQGCRWADFPTQPPLRSRDDGFSAGLDGITVSKLRNESIKAAGNAIVPQVAFEIFKAIELLIK